MARGSSKSSGRTGNRPRATENKDIRPEVSEAETDRLVDQSDAATPVTDSVMPDQADTVSTPENPQDAAQDDAQDGPHDSAHDIVPGDDAPVSAPQEATPHRDDTLMADIAEQSAQDAGAIAPDTPDATPDQAEPEIKSSPAAPTVAPAPAAAKPGGVLPLVLGGVIAAGIGYGAAYFGYLPGQGDTTQTTVTDQSGEIAELTDQIAALQGQIETLANATPPAAPTMAPVDLSPVLDQIAALAPRIEGATAAIDALGARVTALESQPAFGGDLPPDTAAALETAARLEAELDQQRAAAQAQADELAAQAEAAAAAAAQAEAAAQAAIAQAEAETAAAMARAAAEAALGQVQVAIETGQGFAEPLAALAAVADVPDALSATAEAGVPTLETLQTQYPALARAALPLALQETAGEGIGDRLGAFVMGQIGGRSVEPREGDDPDAVLSRVEAAVRAGDLQTALTEIAALPEGARAILAPWGADVEARAGAEAGLAALTAALTGTGN